VGLLLTLSSKLINCEFTLLRSIEVRPKNYTYK
jgi:hypothetical protein